MNQKQHDALLMCRRVAALVDDTDLDGLIAACKRGLAEGDPAHPGVHTLNAMIGMASALRDCRPAAAALRAALESNLTRQISGAAES